MSLSIGNSIAKARIRHLASTNTLPHALLLSGPAGTGKYDFLESIAHILLPHTPLLPPDLVRVNTLYQEGITSEEDLQTSSFDQSHRKKDKKKTDTIGIDDVESFTKHLFETTEHAYKIVLIKNIERFTKEASNTFLKTLEEPPTKTIFLMTTSEEYSILPTIFSRVQKEYFHLSSAEELSSAIPLNYDTERAAWALEMAKGRSAIFTKLLHDETFYQHYKTQWEYSQKIMTLPIADAISLAEEKSKLSTEEIIEFCEGLSTIAHSSLEKGLHSSNQEHIRWGLYAAQTIETAKQQLLANGNKRLVLESLFLALNPL